MIIFVTTSFSHHPTVCFSMEEAKQFIKDTNQNSWANHDITWNPKDKFIQGEIEVDHNDRICVGCIYPQELAKEKWAAATLMDSLGGPAVIKTVGWYVDRFMKVDGPSKKKMIQDIGGINIPQRARDYLLDRYYDLVLL